MPPLLTAGAVAFKLLYAKPTDSLYVTIKKMALIVAVSQCAPCLYQGHVAQLHVGSNSVGVFLQGMTGHGVCGNSCYEDALNAYSSTCGQVCTRHMVCEHFPEGTCLC